MNSRFSRRAALAAGLLALLAAGAWWVASRARPPEAAARAPLAKKGAGQPQAGASLVIDRDMLNFGAVPRHTLLEGAYRLTNTGGAPARLKIVSLSCNCLKLDLPEQIEPGGSAMVWLAVETGTREGEFEASAVVQTSDAARPQLRFALRFHGLRGAAVKPSELEFNDAVRGEALSSRVLLSVPAEVASVRTGPWNAQASADWLSCRLAEAPRRDGRPGGSADWQYEYLVTVDTRGIPAEQAVPAVAFVQFRPPADRSQEVARLPVRVNFAAHPSLRAPGRILLARDGRPVRFAVASRGAAAFEITSATCSDPLVTLAVDDGGARTTHRLTAALARAEEPRERDATRAVQIRVATTLDGQAGPLLIEALILGQAP